MIRWWRDIEKWIEDEGGNHTSGYTEIRIGELLKRKLAPVDRSVTTLSELNVVAKISFGGILYIRSEDEKLGYKGPLFYAHPGDLIISKIRVAQGSFCIVPNELEHLAVSPEYPVYEVDQSAISSEFIRLAIRTEAFRRRVASLRSGNTTKSRIRPADFESLALPVPQLAEQKKLAASYLVAIAEAATLEAEAERIEAEARRAFETALGVAPPPPLPDWPVFVARFKNFERWSHEGMLRDMLGHRSVQSTVWPLVVIGEIGKVTYGIQLNTGQKSQLDD